MGTISLMLTPLTTLPVAWEDLAEAFHHLGGVGMDRDIILPGADLDGWELAMAWVNGLERAGAAQVERWPNPLPTLADFLPVTELINPPDSVWPRQPRMTVDLGALRIDCPFYEQVSIGISSRSRASRFSECRGAHPRLCARFGCGHGPDRVHHRREHARSSVARLRAHS